MDLLTHFIIEEYSDEGGYIIGAFDHSKAFQSQYWNLEISKQKTTTNYKYTISYPNGQIAFYLDTPMFIGTIIEQTKFRLDQVFPKNNMENPLTIKTFMFPQYGEINIKMNTFINCSEELTKSATRI